MKNDKALIALAWAIAGPTVAFAQGADGPTAAADLRAAVVPTPAAVQTASELMRLQEDTLLLKARLKKLDAQAQVAQREQSMRTSGGGIAYGEIALIATQSLGRATAATLSSDGSEFDVQAGDRLPNGSRVAQIRPGRVVLTDPGGHSTMLAVSTRVRGAPRDLAANVIGPVGVPPIPTLPPR